MDTTSIGTVEGVGIGAIDGNGQRIIVFYSGKHGFDQHLRSYHANNLTSFVKVPVSGSKFAFSPGGEWLVATESSPGNAVIGSWKIRGYLCNVTTGGKLPFRGKMNYGGGVQGSHLVTFSPDGTLIALSDSSEWLRSKAKVYIVDLMSIRLNGPLGDKGSTSFRTLLELEANSIESSVAVKWSPSGEFLAHVGGKDKSISLVFWKLTKSNSASTTVEHYGTLALPETLQKGEITPSQHIAFAPDSALLAIAGSKTVPLRLVDVIGLKIVNTTAYDGASMTALAFSPGGKYLVSADANGTLCVWELNTPNSSAGLTLVDKAQLPGAILDFAIPLQGTFALVATKRDQNHVDISRVILPSDPGDLSHSPVPESQVESIDLPVSEKADVEPLRSTPPPAAVPAQPSKVPASEFAPCPKCGSTDAKKVRYTLMGGIVTPLLFHLVKCNKCGKQYNGKTGR